MNLQAIIFDFDGVIVDTEAMHYQATLQALQDENLTFTYEIYREKYIGVPDLLMFPLIGERYGINVHDQKLNELLSKKRAAYSALNLENLPTCPGVVELIETAAEHVPLGICTGAHNVDIKQILPFLYQGKLINYFKTIVTSDDVRRTKPDPEGYLTAAKQLNVSPAHCVVIEDTPTGIQAGKAAGMWVLGVCTSHRPAQLYLADKVVNRLSDISFHQLTTLLR